jgi:hypothetical protein
MLTMAERLIDGKRYQFSQLNTTPSLRLFKRLVAVLGEPMIRGFKSLEKKSDTESLIDQKINFDVLADAAKTLIGNLDKDDPIEIIKELIGDGRLLCDNKNIQFETHYAGQLPHMFKVLTAALEVQYGNFLPALTANLPSVGISNRTPTTQA